MFRRHPESLDDLLNSVMREQGLETPLMQKRIIDAWDIVVGASIAAQTGNKFVKNQTLMVKINNPALRADLSMMRTQLMNRLNDHVGQKVIYDLKIY